MHAADEGSGNESSSELEWRQEWDTDSAWRPWAVHPDPVGVSLISLGRCGSAEASTAGGPSPCGR